jgi:endonuclease YncB( thermonuclease family)
MSLEELQELKEEDLDRFTLKGVKTEAKVVYVYDGDTLDLAFYREDELVRYKCRLEDVKAPELRAENGKLVRDFLAWVCMGEYPDNYDDSHTTVWSKKQLQDELDENTNLVYAVFGDFDKYGRALVTLKKSSRARKTINDMVTNYVHELEQNSESSTSTDYDIHYM